MKRCALLILFLFVTIPAIAGNPRYSKPQNPDQVWQNDLDLSGRLDKLHKKDTLADITLSTLTIVNILRLPASGVVIQSSNVLYDSLLIIGPTNNKNIYFGFQTGTSTGALVATNNTIIGSQSAGANLSLNAFSLSGLGQGIFQDITNGFEETAEGFRSQQHVIDGPSNTSNGAFSLEYNLHGGNNVADGEGALEFGSNLNDNYAGGFTAMQNAVDSARCVAIGRESLAATAHDTDIVAIGYRTLYLSSGTGTGNTAGGSQSGYHSTIASNNAWWGFQSGYQDITGGQDAGFGDYSMTNATSSNSACIGFQCLANDAGGNNFGGGYNACVSVSTGVGDVCLGASSNVGNGGLVNAIAIGSGAVVNANNTAQIGGAVGSPLSVNLNVTSATIRDLIGFTGGLTAPAGSRGEIISSTTAAAQGFATSGQYGDLLAFNLTAGDWTVGLMIDMNSNGATITDDRFGFGTVSGNNSTGLVNGVTAGHIGTLLASFGSASIPMIHVTPTVTTTYYLKYLSDYSIATPVATGSLTALRTY